MKNAKRILSVFLAIVMLFSVMSLAVEAEFFEVKQLYLGYMAPTNSKGTKTIKTVKLYGDYDYINFYIDSQYDDRYFAYEIYSDKKCTKLMDSGVVHCNAGKHNCTFKIKLKGNYSSKTYYMVTYGTKLYGDLVTLDDTSIRQFKVEVKRKADFDDKVVILKKTKNTTKGPNITWSKLSGASKYEIVRRSITGTKWKKVGTVSSKKTSFTDTSVKNKNGNYIYSVKAVNKKGTKSRYLYSGLTCLFAKAPVLRSVKVKGNDVIEVKWKSSGDNIKYNIMRKQGDGKWTTIKSNYSGTTYEDTAVKNRNKYTYSVKAVRSTKYGETTSSYYTNESKKITFLKAPVMNPLETVENGISLSWGKVKGAVGYSVLKKPIGSDEDWKVIATLSAEETSYIDTAVSLREGEYSYTVRSEGDGFSGSYSSGKDYLFLDEPEFAVNVDDFIYVSWKEVPNATEYSILEQQGDGTWRVKGKTSELKYRFASGEYYKAKLSVRAERGDVVSTYKTDVKETVFFPSIKLQIKEFDTYTQFSWERKKADKFRVYRKLKDAPNSDYKLLFETPGDVYTYNYENPEEDIRYNYQIRAVVGDVEQKNNVYLYTRERYSYERCIESFNAYRCITVVNDYYKSFDKRTDGYTFNYKKTDKFKKASTKIYYYSKMTTDDAGWKQLNINNIDLVNIDYPYRFSCVVSDEFGSTPLGAKPDYIGDEYCKAPDVTLTPTKNGLDISWYALEGAVEYEVDVYCHKNKYKYDAVLKEDGSKKYTVSVDDIKSDYVVKIEVSAVHKNSNKTSRIIGEYSIKDADKYGK